MQKILPKETPIIKSYHYDADLLSVVTKHKNYTSWLMNNYIQLEAPPPTNWPAYDCLRVDFYRSSVIWQCCPLVFHQRIKREFVSVNWKSIIDFVISSIKLGYYVYMDIDRYYIPGSVAYLKYESLHDIFVYGFDEDEKIFHYSDFLKNAIYRDSTVTFENLEKAYQGFYNLPIKPYLDKDCIELISLETPKPRDDYSFNILAVKSSIYGYVNSCNAYSGIEPTRYKLANQQNNFLGISVYHNLLYYIEIMLMKNKYFGDMRAISVLCDHKRLMSMRLKYMGGNGYLNNAENLCERYGIVENEMNKVKSILVKCSLTNNMKLLEKIKAIIHHVMEDEKNILFEVLENITDRKVYDSNSNFSEMEINDIVDLTPMRGCWEYRDNKVHGYSYEDNAFALLKVECKDFVYEADILLRDCTAASLVFRADKYLTKFYCANLDTGGYVKLWRHGYEIAVVEYPVQYNTCYNLKIKAQGNNMHIYVNDSLIIDATDDFVQEKGYLGLNIFENRASYENIKYVIL